MSTIQQAYTSYGLPRMLQEHMLLVAGITKILWEAWRDDDYTLDTSSMTTAALIHDMGNMVKFDFGRFSDQIETPPWLTFYKEKKQWYIQKYGTNSEVANQRIAKDLDVTAEVQKLIDNRWRENFDAESTPTPWEQILVCYADSRVAPSGVVSLEQRAKDLLQRYPQSTEQISSLSAKIKTWENILQEKLTFDLQLLNTDDVRKRAQQLLFLPLDG